MRKQRLTLQNLNKKCLQLLKTLKKSSLPSLEQKSILSWNSKPALHWKIQNSGFQASQEQISSLKDQNSMLLKDLKIKYCPLKNPCKIKELHLTLKPKVKGYYLTQQSRLQKKEHDFYFISSWKFIKFDLILKDLEAQQFYNEEHLQEIFQVLFDKTIQSYINIIDCFQTLLSNAAEKNHGKIIQSKPYIILSILLEKILSLEEVLAFFEDCINNRLDIETELDTKIYLILFLACLVKNQIYELRCKQ
ncbi:unnamed protein product [Paramecium octaurelia]|uniref:Uncharacterized protein n=1 Tax=Paramecium octaurelia TaxID=43137 RepID=A0A8S1SJ82_PAROT|nr:unnamed protein product [Paramecium octaurelia]